MNERKPQDSAALMLVVIVGIFVTGTLIALIVGSFLGMQGGENVWAGLFSIVTAVLGAVGGWIAGTTIEKGKRNGNGVPPPTE